MSFATFVLAILAVTGVARAAAGVSLDPVQPVLLPDGAYAKNPLSHLGDVNGISSAIPENCHVDQAAYVLRHGSRFPDTGAHNGWLEMARRFKESSYKATGPLSFFHTWDTPLTRPDNQIAQLSKTGYKELYDLGYTLRTRYPDLYDEGDEFFVWANNYPRVLQTAQLFVRGYLGPNSTLLGNVVSVTGRGVPAHLGDTLAPSDMCPAFKDDSSKQTNAWRSLWLPPFIERLSQYIYGDLVLDDSHWNDFPYICGFESQITGRLSPFCDTFTQEELEQYEYHQDLRYYYGVGPAVDVASKMMTPFLNSLVRLLAKGPAVAGVRADGTPFTLPRLLMSFLNDGQLNQLAAALGVFDGQNPLPTDRIPSDRLWRSSRISPMRGTIALQRLSCRVNGPVPATTTTTTTRSCVPRPTAAARGGTSARNETYIRIRINEAVYPVPSCQDGPGKSCAVARYAKFVADARERNGDFARLCNATDPATPKKVKGASFFTDLGKDHLQIVKP
ncbi:acid phosphatase PHO1 [Verticillium dahliae VdLs.17]|uniref:3-phytase n=1 Tax=Verticillium dahliae (strain VdLs.17 / ATCC MYA-4575 / FGSC 10137) TaxID=498257 RepID=G2X629_VERDV|nr:acid phosphatase PHO1 [Verticillium dahliae VdLs.17]EGY14181.1 acid phosphatase PHO1 [Verticillium dahliae VdLs.17]